VIAPDIAQRFEERNEALQLWQRIRKVVCREGDGRSSIRAEVSSHSKAHGAVVGDNTGDSARVMTQSDVNADVDDPGIPGLPWDRCNLPHADRKRLAAVLRRFKHLFSVGTFEPGRIKGVYFRIDTGDAKPIKSKAHRVKNLVKLEAMRKLIMDMESSGVVRKSKSPWPMGFAGAHGNEG
jgi:hypothetical protein